MENLKKHKIKTKTDKNWKTIWNNILLWVQRLYEECQGTRSKNDKVLREKSHCVVCRPNKSRFLKQKIH